MTKYDTDVLVIGGGLAGLCAAISAASDMSRVMVVTKTLIGAATTTSLAAGIISAVTPFGEGDSVEQHYNDTLKGGGFVNDKALARAMVGDMSKYFSRLAGLGIEFEGDDTPKACFIPGHSKPRSYYMKGKGVRLQSILRNAAAGLGATFMERALVTSLVKEGGRVIGAVGIGTHNNEPFVINAKATVLATGGPGELYPHTLMPIGSTGYGCSLALRAGAELVDMEFVQFYPTMTCGSGLPKIFIEYSSLLKNGADLLDDAGTSIFRKAKIDEPWKLTRDAFSILIAKEMLGGGSEKPVFFDCTKIPAERIKDDLILGKTINDLASKHVPVSTKPFGVSPYAHFVMGGVKSNPNCETLVPGLYAAGEAMGGPHGANRIGGNALAAAIAFGFRSGMAASLYCGTVDHGSDEAFHAAISQLTEQVASPGTTDAAKVKADVQSEMWKNAGILRRREGLESALLRFNALREIRPKSSNPVEKLLLPMMLDTAEIIAISAMVREESRGAHCRLDYPSTNDQWLKRIKIRLEGGDCDIQLIDV